jgi:polar amino acid transport system substrate-binding protein
VGRLDDKALVDAVNAALVKIEADGRMDAIQKKWFGRTFELPKTVPQPEV